MCSDENSFPMMHDGDTSIVEVFWHVHLAKIVNYDINDYAEYDKINFDALNLVDTICNIFIMII